MNFDDKNKLRKAYMDAVSRNPKADEPIQGLVDSRTNEPLTPRSLAINMLASPEFYESIDNAISQGQTTLDDIIEKNFSEKKPQAPAPKAPGK